MKMDEAVFFVMVKVIADAGRRSGGRVSGVGQGHGVEAARRRDEVDAVDALDRVRVGVVIVAVVEAVGVAHERTLAGDGGIAIIQLAHRALRLGERDVAHTGMLGGDVAPDGGRLEVRADHRDHVAVVDLDRHRAGDGLRGSGTIVVRAVGREGDGDGVGVGRAARRVAHIAEVGRRNLRGGVDIAVVVVQELYVPPRAVLK